MAIRHPQPRSSRLLFRHLAPTAVPITGRDVWQGLGSVARPAHAVAHLRMGLMRRTGLATCHCLGSARAALAVALMAFKRLSNRSKVIVSAYTCPTVVQSVLEARLEPVFCDVSVDTLDLDRAALEGLIDEDVLAIVPTHLYGLAQNIDDLLLLGQSEGIFIVEDAAQAFGATLRGRMVGTDGDAGIYSMGRGKCIPAGHGGMLVAQDEYGDVIAEVMKEVVATRAGRDLRAVAMFAGYGLATSPLGWWFIAHSPMNPAEEGMAYDDLPPVHLAPLSPGHAALGASILERLAAVQQQQRKRAEQLMAELSAFEEITLPHIPDAAAPVFLRFPVVLRSEARAQALYDRLGRVGIGVSRSYRRTLPDLCSDVCPSDGQAFPGAAHLAKALLTLPTHAYVQEADIHLIVRAFAAVHSRGG